MKGVENESAGGWVPRTGLGKLVLEGKIKNMNEIFKTGHKIEEPGVVDMLLPDLDHELVLIGGTPGKGGGIRRTVGRRTARMHKSGRRFKTACLAIVGNRNGYVGVGETAGREFAQALEKALQKAKLALIPVRRGCGSWECECREAHSIPLTVIGSAGSVQVMLKPAPKGVGLVVSSELKKLLELAGIRDVWSKSLGKTKTRANFIKAAFDALKSLNRIKITPEQTKKLGIVMGVPE